MPKSAIRYELDKARYPIWNFALSQSCSPRIKYGRKRVKCVFRSLLMNEIDVTLDQRLGVNLKNPFFCSFLLQICYFFAFFLAKNAENDYFDQRLGCAAPKSWSKYTTV